MFGHLAKSLGARINLGNRTLLGVIMFVDDLVMSVYEWLLFVPFVK